MPQTIDTLISSRWMIPVIPENTVLEHHSIAIKGDIIEAILPTQDALSQLSWSNHIDLGEQLLIPGLVNCHGHAAMSLLRGYADDLALMDWLENHIWPAEAKWVGEAFVYDGTSLAIAEMLRSGTTTFSDMYFFPEAAAKAVQHAGLRAQLSFPIFEFPSNWGENAEDYINKGMRLMDQYSSSNKIHVIFGPHAPYTVADPSLEKIAMLAEEVNAPIQIHLHETAFEVEQSIKEHGVRPIKRLQKLGILMPDTQCVHMTALNDEDIEIIMSTRSQVIHCPESNLKLASGFCPVDKLLGKGINVAIGTDGAASNDDLDLLGELKTAALLAKAVSGDPTAMDAHTSLRMATINGAKALGLDKMLGSLEAGKQADITAIDMSTLEAQPVFSPVSSLIYTDSGSRVSNVWCAGKQLLKDRTLITLHEQELIRKAREWGEKIRAN